MRYKIIFLLTSFIFAAFIIFEFIPVSTASSKKGIKPVNLLSRTETTSLRFPILPLQWQTIVNNGNYIPNTELTFGSYGQPAVNTKGLVVFRARSIGGSDRESGIYMRDLTKGGILNVGNINSLVPFPNNLNTEFTEFPSIPRISMKSENIATRGNHRPVYRYFLPDGTETRAGTTGIYTQLENGSLLTGATKLGAVPGFEYYAVPGISPYIPFDVYPGSPAITDDGVIVFKGNYTENSIGKTGVFYRNLQNAPGGGAFPVELIANSDTQIPNAPPEAGFQKFGSTAPPSVAGDKMVFVGLDNEDNPSYGGIYIAPLQPSPTLTTLVGVGSSLPGLQLPALTRIGEGLSFDGKYLAFWAAWGTETKTIRLYCPVDGNSQLIAYCNGVDPNSILDTETGTWYQEKQVPVNQGIFVYDVSKNLAYLAADTITNYNDFIFWGYSGRAPGVGSSDEDGEPPRWRGTAFMSVSSEVVAFKARTGILDDRNVYINPVDGIYLSDTSKNSTLQTVLETGMDGATLLDSNLQPGEMSIIGLGIEREGFRGKYLAITATMANAEESWGGVYLSKMKDK